MNVLLKTTLTLTLTTVTLIALNIRKGGPAATQVFSPPEPVTYPHKLHSNQPVTTLFKTLDDFANDTPMNSVRFHHNERTFDVVTHNRLTF